MNQSILLNPIEMIPVLISYIIISTISLLLIYKKKMNRKITIIILFASILVPGIIFGLSMHPVFASQQLFILFFNISRNPIMISRVLPNIIMISIVLSVFIASTLIFGRIFCGYACPLGAAQELISNISFKNKIKKNKYAISLPEKYTNVIRVAFFISMIATTLIWGFALFSIINPFEAFSIVQNIFNPIALVLPILILIGILITSIFIYRPWCTILCPFGTVAWLTSRLSLFKLKRNDNCTKCQACEKICPTSEAYEQSNKSRCYLCNRCTEICPSDAIEFKKK